MNTHPRVLGLLTFILVATPILAQDTTRHISSSLAVGGGINLPVGEWREHRLATAVNQFGPSWTIWGDLEFPISASFAVTLIGGYAPLATAEWEEYARSRGDTVSASAQIAYVLLGLRPSLLSGPEHRLKLDVAFGYSIPGGEESYRGFSYEYNFLSSGFALLGGLEYDKRLSDTIELFARASILIAFDAVEYVGGKTYTAYSVPAVAGLRFGF